MNSTERIVIIYCIGVFTGVLLGLDIAMVLSWFI